MTAYRNGWVRGGGTVPGTSDPRPGTTTPGITTPGTSDPRPRSEGDHA